MRGPPGDTHSEIFFERPVPMPTSHGVTRLLAVRWNSFRIAPMSRRRSSAGPTKRVGGREPRPVKMAKPRLKIDVAIRATTRAFSVLIQHGVRTGLSGCMHAVVQKSRSLQARQNAGQWRSCRNRERGPAVAELCGTAAPVCSARWGSISGGSQCYRAASARTDSLPRARSASQATGDAGLDRLRRRRCSVRHQAAVPARDPRRPAAEACRPISSLRARERVNCLCPEGLEPDVAGQGQGARSDGQSKLQASSLG